MIHTTKPIDTKIMLQIASIQVYLIETGNSRSVNSRWGGVSEVNAAVSGGNSERLWDRGGDNAEIQRAKGRRGSLGFSGGEEMVEFGNGVTEIGRWIHG